MNSLLKYCEAYEKGAISAKIFKKFVRLNKEWIFRDYPQHEDCVKDNMLYLALFSERFPFFKDYISKYIPHRVEAIKDATVELKNADEVRFLYQYIYKIQINPTIYDNYDLKAIHQSSIYNKELLKKHDVCGCFYCKKIFNPDVIHFWIDDNQTAMCPYCGIDSVIGPACGYPLTKGLLYIMGNLYFGG